MVLRRLSGKTENTAPVLTLITQFGGGKTHTLTALYHLANAGADASQLPGVAALLNEAEIAEVPSARVGVFVGNAWDPTEGRETPWIDLARQLAGDQRRRCAWRCRTDHTAWNGFTGQSVRCCGSARAAAVRRGAQLRQPPQRHGRKLSRVHSESDRRRYRYHPSRGGHQPAAQPGRDDRLGSAVAGPAHQGGPSRGARPDRQ